MGKILLPLLLIAVLASMAYAWWQSRQRTTRPHIVVDDEIQGSARDNYLMLDEAIGLHRQLLKKDENFPFLTLQERDEVEQLVDRFTRRQLGR